MTVSSSLISVVAAAVSLIGVVISIYTNVAQVDESKANTDFTLKKIEQSEASILPKISNLESETDKLKKEVSIQSFRNELQIVRELRPLIRLSGTGDFKFNSGEPGVHVDPLDFSLKNNGLMPVLLKSAVFSFLCDGEEIYQKVTGDRGIIAKDEVFRLNMYRASTKQECKHYEISMRVVVEADESSSAIVEKYYPEVLEALPSLLRETAVYHISFD
ncbi:hypothetical protein [Thalassospira povalilytica]|uniref:hypothetical protein n=1 Tax=Thalassospira povalilytica TaxID=732237 RepID=UPI003AA7B504